MMGIDPSPNYELRIFRAESGTVFKIICVQNTLMSFSTRIYCLYSIIKWFWRIKMTPSQKKSALDALERIDKNDFQYNGFDRDIDLIRTALSSDNEAGWRTIESAPKLGRILLLAENQCCYGHWYKTYNRWEYDGYSFGNPKTQPTH